MLNRADIMGNLGSDPRISPTADGRKVASFSVATTDRGYTSRSGEKVEARTEWHNVVCFGNLAEIAAQYLHKGDRVYISGKLRTRSYMDKSGAARYVTEINATEMEMCGGRPQGSGDYPSGQDYQSPQPPIQVVDDNGGLPF